MKKFEYTCIYYILLLHLSFRKIFRVHHPFFLTALFFVTHNFIRMTEQKLLLLLLLIPFFP